jgi:hypothetical protein
MVRRARAAAVKRIREFMMENGLEEEVLRLKGRGLK